jgi:neurotransmitter:Na+ symporter, NSS family
MTTRKASSQWSNTLAFVIAALASALGLGSLWKFPYIAAENGGGIFVVVYLICIALLGVPVMIAEILIGRSAQSSPVKAFSSLALKYNRAWSLIGLLGVVTGVLILSYYSVVAGWSLHYLSLSLTGGIPSSSDPAVHKQVFDKLLGTPGVLLLWHGVMMMLTAMAVLRGVRDGFEKICEWLMAILFIILTGMLIYSMTLPSFGTALGFVFGLHSDKFTSQSVLVALGHAFFTLSLGMGAMLTYGSYLGREQNIVSTAVTVSVMDTIASLMACLVVYPVSFAAGLADPGKEVGLVYINLPVAIQSLPFGRVWMSAFFILLFVAGLASAISLLEVPVSVMIDSWGMTRVRATTLAAGTITLLGVPTTLSNTASFFNNGFVDLFGLNWFDLVDYLAANWLLPIGGIGTCLFLTFAVNKSWLMNEFTGGNPKKVIWFQCFYALTAYVAPALTVLVFLDAIKVI